MGLLCDTYIFYADVYFMQNCIIKFVVLMLVILSSKNTIKLKWIKIGGMSLIATCSEILFLMLSSSYLIFRIFVIVVEIPCMMLLLVDKRKDILLKSIVMGYVFLILINGTLEIFWNIFGDSGHFLMLLILSCFVVIFGIRMYLHQRKIQKGIFTVELYNNAVHISTKAYYDSGNRLKDPYIGKGVHIISNHLFEKLELMPETRVCVPFQALGNTDGLLDVYYIDCIKIFGEKEPTELQKIPVGVTKDELFQGKQYEMILNEDVW